MNKIDPDVKYPDKHVIVWVYHLISNRTVKAVTLGYWTGTSWQQFYFCSEQTPFAIKSITNVVGWTELTPPKI